MPDVGTGTTITWGSSTFTSPLLSIDWDPGERVVVDTTSLSTTTARIKMPGDLVDYTGVTVVFQYDPDEQAPITAAEETITITYPIPSGGAGGATHAFTGFVDSFTPGNAGIDELMTATMHLTVDGNVTYADST